MKIYGFKFSLWIFFICIVFFVIGCNQNYIPKPRGYFRIDFPEKQYRRLDSIFPFIFEYPSYAEIIPDQHSPNEKNWINIYFNKYKANVHLSYKAIDDQLIKYIEDSHTMAFKHVPKASAIDNKLVNNPEARVYGLIYEISGSGAASSYQFFVTDSINHFLRGALYFNIVPNNDSMAPVIEFLKKDIEHLIATLSWKNQTF